VIDLVTGLTERWRSTVRNTSARANRDLAIHDNLATYESPLPHGDGWTGSWPLGSGSFGSAQLFVQQNTSGQICNRVVVKDCDYDRPGFYEDLWNSKRWWFWLKDLRDKDIPVEVKTMSTLRRRIGSEYVVKLLSWRIAEERKLYRLYLEVYYIGQISSLRRRANIVAVR